MTLQKHIPSSKEDVNKMRRYLQKVHRHFTIVGAFPPPMHGMAAVNAAVHEHLVAAGAEVLVINVAAPSLDRGLMQRLGRFPRVLRGLIGLAFLRGVREKPLYMSVSGGWGQVYEMAFLVVARARRMRVVLHHHSFAYLDHPNHLTAWLLRLAGRKATQVVLSKGMGERLTACYGVQGEVLVMSNAAVLLDEGVGQDPPTVRDDLHALCVNLMPYTHWLR